MIDSKKRLKDALNVIEANSDQAGHQVDIARGALDELMADLASLKAEQRKAVDELTLFGDGWFVEGAQYLADAILNIRLEYEGRQRQIDDLKAELVALKAAHKVTLEARNYFADQSFQSGLDVFACVKELDELRAELVALKAAQSSAVTLASEIRSRKAGFVNGTLKIQVTTLDDWANRVEAGLAELVALKAERAHRPLTLPEDRSRLIDASIDVDDTNISTAGDPPPPASSEAKNK